MQNTSFNTYMAKYVYYANQLATARCEYIVAKERYRRFAKTENQLGKPGKKEHYEPPLTMCKKRDILKIEAQKCKTAKNNVKLAQQQFGEFRRKLEKAFKESGLTIWYWNLNHKEA